MKKLLLLVLASGAALAINGGGIAAHADGIPTRNPKMRARTTAQKNGADKKVAADKKVGARALEKSLPEKPKVTELKEVGLKSLFEASAARKRPLLVNFWATWCVPCRTEFPDLVKIRAQFAADRLDFVTISLDDVSEIATGVPEFLQEVRADAIPAFLLNADDPEAAINMIDPTWRGELPATFLFDRTGAVVFIHKGRVKPLELAAAIEKTLGAKE
ncbi:MAG: TlpA family protein disulfide reductase [Acidobacteria bacterium]|nr:TlpA family protein disulfide reductase [Acidobacteriota bacterium]